MKLGEIIVKKKYKSMMDDFNVMNHNGTLHTTKEFIKLIKEGYISDYDGTGYFCNVIDGKITYQTYVECDVKYIKKNKRKYPFVIWFNK